MEEKHAAEMFSDSAIEAVAKDQRALRVGAGPEPCDFWFRTMVDPFLKPKLIKAGVKVDLFQRDSRLRKTGFHPKLVYVLAEKKWEQLSILLEHLKDDINELDRSRCSLLNHICFSYLHYQVEDYIRAITIAMKFGASYEKMRYYFENEVIRPRRLRYFKRKAYVQKIWTILLICRGIQLSWYDSPLAILNGCPIQLPFPKLLFEFL
jgi:hypothetical protein